MGNSVMLNGVEYAGEQIAYKDSTYELVSKVAYLIGVPLRIFQNEHEPPKPSRIRERRLYHSPQKVRKGMRKRNRLRRRRI